MFGMRIKIEYGMRNMHTSKCSSQGFSFLPYTVCLHTYRLNFKVVFALSYPSLKCKLVSYNMLFHKVMVKWFPCSLVALEIICVPVARAWTRADEWGEPCPPCEGTPLLTL